MSSSGMDRNAHSLMLSIQHVSLPTTASPTLQGALKDGFGKAVVTRDMFKPCTFPPQEEIQLIKSQVKDLIDCSCHSSIYA